MTAYVLPMSGFFSERTRSEGQFLTLLQLERPKLYAILAFLTAIGLKERICSSRRNSFH